MKFRFMAILALIYLAAAAALGWALFAPVNPPPVP